MQCRILHRKNCVLIERTLFPAQGINFRVQGRIDAEFIRKTVIVLRRKIAIILAAVGVLLPGLLIWPLDLPHWQKLDLERIHAQPRTTLVYDADGNETGALFASQNRQWVPLEDIPEHVQAAFIAAEDQRFYQHGGIDVRRIFGALWHDVKTMSFSQGASTITQQLVKLTHLSGEKTISRKAQEIVLALQLEKKLSKDEILEAYLNTVYFGAGAYGIETAAQVYFGKSAAQLSLPEGALLAGIIKAPGSYAPHIKPENALNRRNHVLAQMYKSGAIDQLQLRSAQDAPLKLNMAESASAGQGWYMDQVLTEAEAVLDMSTEEILSAGLRIYTAFSPKLQDEADALFENGANFPDPAADGTAVQAALIAMDTSSGEIRALIGGRDYEVQRGFNRAIQMQRQPGSAIKPVSTYAAAINDCGLMPFSIAEDVQREFQGGYRPGNAGGNYYGSVTLREALSRSLNVATVDLADLIGMHRIRKTIAAFGLPLAPQDVNLALSLGSMTHGVSPAQLCAAYCALGNGGMQVMPHAIRRITDSDGRTLYEHKAANERAVKASTAFLVTDMLKTAASEGSAKALAGAGIPAAGKTGTVGEEGGGNRDVWTAAYTPELAVTVWMGFDEPDAEHALPDYAGGSSYPAKLCAAFLRNVSPTLTGGDFAAPEELAPANIDRAALESTKQILLAAENTPEEYTLQEWFFRDSLPAEVSPLWNAPQMVNDLTLLSDRGEPPSLAFTSRDDTAEYLILRKNGDKSEIAAVLASPRGNIIVWADTEADLNEAYEYSVLPRHRLLYESGTLLTGPESASVEYMPKGILNTLFG